MSNALQKRRAGSWFTPRLGTGRPAGQSRYTGSGESLVCSLRCLHFPSGEGLYTVHHRKRAAELLEHLQLLIDLDPNRFWFVVLDNASAHTTPAFAAIAVAHKHLELVYLPTYSSHLNHIERLWRLVRSTVTRNRFYESLTAVAQPAVRWLDNLPFAQYCSLMGIHEHQLVFVNKPFS